MALYDGLRVMWSPRWPSSGLRRLLVRLQIPSRPLDGSNAEGGAARVSNDNGGLWLSLVERFVRDEEVVGSNPASPTTAAPRI